METGETAALSEDILNASGERIGTRSIYPGKLVVEHVDGVVRRETRYRDGVAVSMMETDLQTGRRQDYLVSGDVMVPMYA